MSVQQFPRGIRNNNPGNVRRGREIWHGEVFPGSDNQFIQFISMSYGLRCMALILSKYVTVYGLDTIEKIIARWAPASENDTRAYVDHVAKLMGISPYFVLPNNYPLVDAYLGALIEAICIHENGGRYITSQEIEKAFHLAGYVW